MREECLAVEAGGSSGDINDANGMSDPPVAILPALNRFQITITFCLS